MQELVTHPATRVPLKCRCRAQAQWSGSNRLALRYELEGDLAALRLPGPASQPARRDGLWQNTCFELFMRRPGQHGYLEANFAPSGHWAAWLFRDYRDGATPIDMTPPRIEVPRRAAQGLLLQVELQFDAALLASLAPGEADASRLPWQLGLSAVLEVQDDSLSYWALAHPPARADFHDVVGHVLALATRRDDARSHA
jgi:hypothetical protein